MKNLKFEMEELSNELAAPADLSRRNFLFDSAMGFGGIALSSLLTREAVASNPQSAIQTPQSCLPKPKRASF